MTVFKRLLNAFGMYIAFAPLVYFTVSLFAASVFKAIAAFIGMILIANYLQGMIYMKRVKAQGKAVLITGCDSGFGNLSAHELANMGMVVYAGCLDANTAANNLKFTFNETKKHSHPGGKIIPVQLDVTKQSEVESAKSFITNSLNELNIKLWAVVNNAGLGLASEAELTSMSTAERIFSAHEEFSRGEYSEHSIGLPHSGVYSASKAAVLKWSESLRIEMLKFDIQVICICPDFYKTQMTSPEAMVAGYDAEIARMPKDVLDAYGQDYLDNLRTFLFNKDKVTMTNSDTSPVINAICNSVLCFRPPQVNLPITFTSRLMKAMLESWLMPEILSQWILMTISEQDKVNVAWSSQLVTRRR